MRAAFERLADHVFSLARPGELLTLRLQAEISDFVRFNRGLVRQPGTVDQRVVTLRLVHDGRQAAAERTVTGSEADLAAIEGALADLRVRIGLLPSDPQLHLPEGAATSETVASVSLPPTDAMVADILDLGAGLDLVGFLAAGPVVTGYATSSGQRHWHESRTFNLEWCLYLHGNVAVKNGYAGETWDREALRARMDESRRDLAVLGRPLRTLAPGAYRAWLTPSAAGELLGLASGWGGFSARAVRTSQSPLLGLWEGRERFSPLLHLTEDARGGAAPRFDEDGWMRPDRLRLVDRGGPGSLLVSSRSALEFGLEPNGAVGDESATSLDVAAGDVSDPARALGTGLWIGALWYTNWSNRFAGRATGMTRFATFWYEDGEPVAPVAAMRFDDSLYRTFGTELEGLGRDRETFLSASTYNRRSSESVVLPGCLLRSFALTL